jgi:hypothetical protein
MPCGIFSVNSRPSPITAARPARIGTAETDAVKFADLCSIFTDASKLVPVALAVGVATVLNGQLDPNTTKPRLVFLRWRNALPGHRAFSRYINVDPRIDPKKVETLVGSPLPVAPAQQNSVWYRLYKTVENDPAVLQVHRDFLLTRDYAGLTVRFIIFYGAAGFVAAPSQKVAVIYLGFLLLQYLIVRQAASRYGIRMVTTVLARVAHKPDGRQSSGTRVALRNSSRSNPL